MSTSEPWDALIQGYLNGTLSESEAAELAALLASNPEAADAFARAARVDALLEAHFIERRQAAQWRHDEAVKPAPRRFTRSRMLVAVALAASVLLAISLPFFRSPTEEVVEHRCISGRVLVNGVEASTIPDGAQVTVVGADEAAIRLKDGDEMVLAPSSSAVIQSDAAGASVGLVYGQAKFRVVASNRPVRVSTPAGAVSGRGAQFAVESQATESPGVSAMGSNVLALLTVAVLAGQVEVQQADQKVKVSAGESRAFAAEKKPMFTGRVVSVSDDGTRIKVEGKSPKPGLPPQQREVTITSATQSTYWGMPKGADHPTVGQRALVALNPASPETALTVEFGNSMPTLAGGVRAVAADGSEITVEVYRKNDAPEQRTIKISDRTRLTYVGVDAQGEKPTVGYQANVWLAEGTDEADEIRFVFKTKKSPPASPNEPKKPATKKAPAEKKPGEPNKDNPKGEKPNPKQPPVDKSTKPEKKPDEPRNEKLDGKKPGAKQPPVEKPAPEPKSKLPENAKPAKPDASQAKKSSPVTIASAAGAKPSPELPARRTSNRDVGTVVSMIDGEITRRLDAAKIPVSPPAGDAEFLRRAYLDLTGTIPNAAAAAAFLDSSDPQKRGKLIDELLANPAYGRRFAAVWKRLISPKPANNGKPQVDRFTPWLADRLNQNHAWNEIVRELITTDASLARDPQGFFLAASSEGFEPRPNLLAAATGRLFLGVQLGCAECHNHPFANWKQTEFWSLAAFYSRLHKRSKADFGLTEEPLDPTVPVSLKIPVGGQSGGTMVSPQFLGGSEPQLAEGTELRVMLADWITARDNPYFARAAVNRLWAHFFARGLVEPLDGFQAGHSPSHPEVLDRLADEFVASDFDLQHIVRILCNSAAYARTSRPQDDNASDTELLSHMAVKALSADVLFDVLANAVGSNPSASQSARAGKLPSAIAYELGSRDEFINFFAGSAADVTSQEYALGIPQLLRLMNAEAFNVGSPLAKALAASDATADEKITSLYLATLSRRPNEQERSLLVSFVNERGPTEQSYAGALWTLLNSSEFVLNR